MSVARTIGGRMVTQVFVNVYVAGSNPGRLMPAAGLVFGTGALSVWLHYHAATACGD